MHLDEDQLHRLLHGELPPTAARSAREHLAACAECRHRAADAEREEGEVFALLRHLDHPAPQIDAESIATQAGAHGVAWGRWAAGILLAIGLAGGAYALPGSPIPRWVESVAAWIGGRPSQTSLVPAPTPAPESSVAGIAVDPGPTLLIVFTAPDAEGHARVSLTDGSKVVVRGPSGAATFTSDAGRLAIENQGSSATFEIQIPRAAPRVEIQVGGTRIFLKEGPGITTEQTMEAGDVYLLRLSTSGS